MDTENKFIKFDQPKLTPQQSLEKAKEFYKFLDRRRTVREFSPEPVSKEVIEQLILAASTAPSGAHKQPYTFCAINNPEVKKKIRLAAEEEEFKNYHGRMNDEWLNDLKKFETSYQKPYLEIAPWLIVLFKQPYGIMNGEKVQHYYVTESVGIACGMFLAAVHKAGLVAVTHTPSPLGFLGDILNRPKNEKPFLLIPVGYAHPKAKVPELQRKELSQVTAWYE